MIGKTASPEKEENQKDKRELCKSSIGIRRERGKENNGVGEDEKEGKGRRE